jgi:hypothetical protein
VLKETIYNTTFFCDVIVSDLLENVFAYSRKRTLKGALVHVDNTHPHNSKKSNEYLTEFRARRVLHLADSQKFAPSNFFFGNVKKESQNHDIHTRHDLILAIRAIFDEIPKDRLNSV